MTSVLTTLICGVALVVFQHWALRDVQSTLSTLHNELDHIRSTNQQLRLHNAVLLEAFSNGTVPSISSIATQLEAEPEPVHEQSSSSLIGFGFVRVSRRLFVTLVCSCWLASCITSQTKCATFAQRLPNLVPTFRRFGRDCHFGLTGLPQRCAGGLVSRGLLDEHVPLVQARGFADRHRRPHHAGRLPFIYVRGMPNACFSHQNACLCVMVHLVSAAAR